MHHSLQRSLLHFLFISYSIIYFIASIPYTSATHQKCKLITRKQAAFQQHPVINSSTTASDDTPTSSTSASSSSHSPTATISTSSRSPTPTSIPDFAYGTDKIRGVNLGGWLVLEPWITPSVFESTGNDNIIDEFTLGQLLDTKTAQTILKQHWDTWITEDDFVQIAAAGLNHVRIPIGYWSIPITSSDTSTSTSTAPYTPGAWPYLLNALTWARNHGISVIVDLHGAPGSQNGYDNSGQLTPNPVWGITPDNVTRTVDTLRFMAKEIGDQVAVIELLNEGAGFRGSDWATTIRNFFGNAYEAVRGAAGDDVKVMIGDAFLGVDSWTNFLTPPNGQGAMMDFHEYQIFSDLELDRTFDEHIDFACTYTQSLGSYQSTSLWTVVGEWSNALTDCAQWLNGRGVGARWDGTWFPGPSSQVHGSCSGFTGNWENWTDDYKDMLRKYWEVQVEVGETVQGWVFWTWKAENADEWSYQKGLEGGWIPMDPTNRKFPNICG
ncbi:glycoside hydrolase family 5 protein [Panaeolus papilionaceus]|nr:glycoside hydrolase family 5 protein [Panaeolus papilionaceus]